ncbi:MAG: M42 family metallopeptidase [Firmicutes bacterium]|nr:M42 family metallopeptidase [Bacillota bacterium]
MNLHDYLRKIIQIDGVSGYEDNVAAFISETFSPYVDSTRTDNLGNLILYKRGSKKDAPSILFAAHMDEIGLIVTKIEDNGFLRFTSLGGFDVRTLPGQEVTVYGQKPVNGIIGFKPSYLDLDEEKGQSVEMKNLFIDTGFPREQVEKNIRIGSIAAIKRGFLPLLNNRCAGKAFDDRAGIAVLWQCARELVRIEHEAHLYFVATVQEEVGTRGAIVSTYGISPDLGIAVDVCHGDFPGAMEHEVSPLGEGAVVTVGPNIHPLMAKRLFETAEEYNLPCQRDVSPGPTGTDARAIQISLEGIPTALVSVPLRYMHTSVELIAPEDVKIAGRLLAYFAAGLNRSFLEELSCL